MEGALRPAARAPLFAFAVMHRSALHGDPSSAIVTEL
jgi:hypothetical protein